MSDIVLTAIRKARRATSRAIISASDDLRTNDPRLIGSLDSALQLINEAEQWMNDLLAEESDATAPDAIEPLTTRYCGSCEEEFTDPGAAAVCAGCGLIQCEDCMGDGEYCQCCEDES